MGKKESLVKRIYKVILAIILGTAIITWITYLAIKGIQAVFKIFTG